MALSHTTTAPSFSCSYFTRQAKATHTLVRKCPFFRGQHPKQCTSLRRRRFVSSAMASDAPLAAGSVQLREAQMERGRAVMRAWWLKKQLEQARAEVVLATLRFDEAETSSRQLKREKGRAVLRAWWLEQLLLKVDSDQPAFESPQAKPASSSDPNNFSKQHDTIQQISRTQYARFSNPSNTATSDASAPGNSETTIPGERKEAKTLKASVDPIEELVSLEVQKEKAARQQKLLEARAEKQKLLDQRRLAMRKWWIQEREATKRALGLPPYEPVWTLVRADGKQEPISIGKVPIVIGSDVSKMEKVVPVQMDYPTVSRVHARVFGKEVMHRGEYIREYFVVDLKSTNGVKLNDKRRLRPGDEYKLNNGDILFLGEKAATLIIKQPERGAESS